MKHLMATAFLSLATLTLAPVSPVLATSGGFQGPIEQSGSTTTVASALTARDDTRVILTGNIVSRMAGDDDEYLFRDATGDIVVEIDEHLFQGRTVTPETRVRLSGKVDKDFGEAAKVDAKWLELL